MEIPADVFDIRNLHRAVFLQTYGEDRLGDGEVVDR
jgi:hypothetical protein